MPEMGWVLAVGRSSLLYENIVFMPPTALRIILYAVHVAIRIQYNGGLLPFQQQYV